MVTLPWLSTTSCAPPAVTDAFCASRLGGDWGHAFGTLGSGVDLDAIVRRAMPIA